MLALLLPAAASDLLILLLFVHILIFLTPSAKRSFLSSSPNPYSPPCQTWALTPLATQFPRPNTRGDITASNNHTTFARTCAVHMVDRNSSNRLPSIKRTRIMETINRFSTSSSSEADSPRPSLSSRFSVSDLRARSVQTPVSSTMGVNDPQSSTNSRVMNSLDTDTASSHCQDDPDVWFERFHDEVDDVELSDDVPTQSQLDTAANIPIYDPEGNSRPFRHLYQGAEHQGQRQLIIFVRHFYCGVCQWFHFCLLLTLSPLPSFANALDLEHKLFENAFLHIIPTV